LLVKIREQKGIILMMTILMLTFLLVLMGIVGDFMRMFVVKRELQDALDAAVISAAQIDSDKKQSQYIYEVWHTCTACNQFSCWTYCCHPPYAVSITRKTVDNPDELGSSQCDIYRGEYNRWIDYNKGQSPQALAQDVFNGNIDASALIKRGQSNGDIQSAITPVFYINNVQGSPLYPSIAGEVTITIKPYILNKIIGVSTIPITCRSQSNTDYEVFKNGIYKGLNPVPAPQWSGGGIIGGGQRSRPN
jgi:hypothetical protein